GAHPGGRSRRGSVRAAGRRGDRGGALRRRRDRAAPVDAERGRRELFGRHRPLPAEPAAEDGHPPAPGRGGRVRAAQARQEMSRSKNRSSESKAASELVQLVAFRMGEGQYALDILRIKEIIHPLRITAVPKAPPFIEGVIELRGAILPIVDLRKRFDLPATGVTRATKYLIVVIEVAERRMLVALIVDGVTGPFRVPPDQLRAGAMVAEAEAAYFSGVVHYHERIYMVLDLDAILTSREKITLAGLAGGPA